MNSERGTLKELPVEMHFVEKIDKSEERQPVELQLCPEGNFGYFFECLK